MFLKIIGASIIILSSSLIGITVKQRHKILISELDNLMSCLRIIKQEISLSLSDITSIFEKRLSYASGQNYIIFDNFIRKAKNSNGDALSDTWTNSLREVQANLLYCKEDLLIITELGSLLGAGDSNTQNDNIINIENKLQERIKIYNSKTEKTDISSKLGIYAGIVIVILLI